MPVSDLNDSRAATNALLGMLQQGRWRPRAAARFLGQAADRSARQAARRPRALAELTALHCLLLALTRDQGPGRRWVANADSLADAAYWTWLVLRHEPSRTVRAAAIAAWAVPVGVVTAIGIRRGAMPERPRPTLLRPAAAMQGIVALRHLLRR